MLSRGMGCAYSKGMAKQWWVVEVSRFGRPVAFIGRVQATKNEIIKALGPYLTLTGNLVTVWGKP